MVDIELGIEPPNSVQIPRIHLFFLIFATQQKRARRSDFQNSYMRK